ncbi:MAG: ABC transporter ATP-binding protein [Clostridiaceae bacterium]|nr:ABC transporter ATP-binding protein [Clostridiaceae bacterium]
MSLISVQNLTRDYGRGRGVFDLSFSIEEGEVFGFLGPNGAGKTTTIRHLMGFLEPRQGKCSIKGYDCWQQRPVIQSDLGYIPGEIAFLNGMKGGDFLAFIARYRGKNGLDRIDELVDRFEVDLSEPLKKMSKGSRQKVGIIAAFMHDPAVLILDEPSSGLDPLMQNRFVDLILEEKKRGKTVLLSSHMFEEVERTCDRVAIIRKGRLAAEDDIDILKQNRLRRYRLPMASEEAARAFASEYNGESKVRGPIVELKVFDDLKEMTQLMARYPLENLSAPDLSLEEIFLQYYGDDGGGES